MLTLTIHFGFRYEVVTQAGVDETAATTPSGSETLTTASRRQAQDPHGTLDNSGTGRGQSGATQIDGHLPPPVQPFRGELADQSALPRTVLGRTPAA